MYQGGSDGFIGPRDDIVASEAWGIDMEAEVAVITGKVSLGSTSKTSCRTNPIGDAGE